MAIGPFAVHIQRQKESVGVKLQTTVSKVLVFRGIGLHSGEEVELKLCPAPANFGICFF
ncbi:MAG: UDP-3-O-acyl-N-acetylglucosamine deacetylase, partial [Paracoccaceae bacterium]